MNFLAHLHLARLANSSLLGNLVADFVRGSPDDQYSAAVVAGIYMHRRVDALTDTLPEVKTARGWFRPETRRVSPITLDVMWDHFLSRHWAQLSPHQPLRQFLRAAQAEITPQLAGTPPGFVTLNDWLWSEHWMERYADMPFIQDVLARMALRRPRLNALAESWGDLEQHYHQLEQLFWQFYPRMMAQAQARTL